MNADARRANSPHRSPRAVIMSVALLAACTRREESPGAVEMPGAKSNDRAACMGDSLRPVTAAPAPGLWLYESASSGARVAAMIGPPRQDGRSLAVTRPVESIEVTTAGDTIHHRIAAASVSLELLPTPGGNASGEANSADSAGRAVGGSTQPAATYAPSPEVRLASYEPCAISAHGPRIRYLRRNATGRIITDVMLHRASGQ